MVHWVRCWATDPTPATHEAFDQEAVLSEAAALRPWREPLK